MQKPLPARPSLEQFKKQAKELVRNHRARDAASFALIREFLPSLAGKTDEEIFLFPFALHDAQSVMARQYGFPSWNQLRDHLESESNHPAPDAAVDAKFKTICQAYEQGDYGLFCSVMSEGMRTAVPRENFASAGVNLAIYFQAEYRASYIGEMIQGDHAIHFWRLSAPGAKSDFLVRVGVKDDLVSGLLFTPPFGGAGAKK
jgi:hypothetical protein